jgi:hypothetical protein
MKIAINIYYGGFGLSEEAQELYSKYSGITDIRQYSIPRNDPHLIRVIEELQEKAGARYSKLKIVEVPDDIKWHISEYDGWEHVAEDHRTWS